MLADVGLCHRKAYWAWLRHKKPAAGSIHLVAGGAYAAGLEAGRKAAFERGAVYRHQILPSAVRAACAAWGDFDSGTDDRKPLWRVLEALDYYFTEHPPHTDYLQPYYSAPGKPALEFSFALPLPGTKHPETGEPILYSGRSDMIAQLDSSLFIIDDKTASQLGASWPTKWDLRGQFLGYMWAARELLRLRVSGICARALCFRGPSVGYECAEKLVHFHQWQVDEWLLTTIRRVQHWADEFSAGRFDKAYGEACTFYGGCDYKELCNKRDPEHWLEPGYVEYRWDPLSLKSEFIK